MTKLSQSPARRLSTLFASAALTPLLMAGSAMAADINVQLQDVRAGGTLYVGLQTEDIFLQDSSVNGQMLKKVQAGDVTIILKDVAPGQYSVSVWHDLDDDGVFDRMENGRPLDGWAMYNGGKLMGPPTWGTVSFTITDAGFTMTESLNYPAE